MDARSVAVCQATVGLHARRPCGIVTPNSNARSTDTYLGQFTVERLRVDSPEASLCSICALRQKTSK